MMNYRYLVQRSERLQQTQNDFKSLFLKSYKNSEEESKDTKPQRHFAYNNGNVEILDDDGSVLETVTIEHFKLGLADQKGNLVNTKV